MVVLPASKRVDDWQCSHEDLDFKKTIAGLKVAGPKPGIVGQTVGNYNSLMCFNYFMNRCTFYAAHFYSVHTFLYFKHIQYFRLSCPVY